jgi:UDP-glucose 4-epimerase
VTLADRRVLVTGATGFIGSHAVRRFRRLGAQVHAVSRQDKPTDPLEPGLTWWRCDLTQPEETTALVRQVAPDLVVHLASEVTGGRDPRLVPPTLWSNLASVVHLLSACLDVAGVRVVLAGSIEEPEPGDVPSSPYAAAKSAATAYARMFHELWDLPATTLRIAMVYGPGQLDRTKLVPYVATSLLRGEPPELSSGHREIDWVYIDDVLDAIVAALDTPAPGAVLQIGSGTSVSIRDTVDELVRLVRPDVAPRYGALADRALDAARIADPSGADAVIGWRAKTPLAEGLCRTVEWYREHL